METCCGYGYGLARKSVKGVPAPWKGPSSANVDRTGDLVLKIGGKPVDSLFSFRPVDVRELTTPSEATSSLRGASVLRPWVSALACIFKDRRRRTGRRKNRGALRYHDPIALRVASRVTES